jgi:outer membrane protein assembly factor BamD
MRLTAILSIAFFLCALPAVTLAAGQLPGPTQRMYQKLQEKHKAQAQSEKERNADAKELYQKAQDKLEDGNYKGARELFEQIQTNHPFSPYATQAQMESIYASYQRHKPSAALAQAKRFLREHPTYPSVDYVYYLQGVINFSRAKNQSNRFFHVDGARRDDTYVKQAFDSFDQLIHRFPNSRYAADAHKRMLFLKNELARRWWHIANYYMRRHAWIAANRRAQGIVKKFQGTQWVHKALGIMEESYKKLGMDEQAGNVEKVIQYNYHNPHHKKVETDSDQGKSAG